MSRFNTRYGVPILTRRDIEDLYPTMRETHDIIESKRDPERPMANKILTGLEVGVGALGVGMLAGRLGTTQIGNSGIPLGLVLGAVGHGINAFGLAGKYGDHVANVSNGAIAGWATLWAAGQGAQMRQRAGQPAGIIAGQAPMHALPYSASPQIGPAPMQFNSMQRNAQNEVVRPLTEAELQIIAQNQR